MINQWYYIAFIPTKTGSLYEKAELKGFNHVMMFYPDVGYNINNATYFTIIEHSKMYVSWGVVERDALEQHLSEATVIMRVKSKRVPRAKWWWWIPTPDTCVTICKQILGIRKPFIWSPYQLYKHILKEHTWEAVG